MTRLTIHTKNIVKNEAAAMTSPISTYWYQIFTYVGRETTITTLCPIVHLLQCPQICNKCPELYIPILWLSQLDAIPTVLV